MVELVDQAVITWQPVDKDTTALRVKWYIFLLIPFIVFLFTLWQVTELAGSDLVQSYPFMWPDSFDWIINGLYYLQEFIFGQGADFTPTIRHPLFTLLVTAFYYFDRPAWLLVINQTAFFGTIVLSLLMMRQLSMRPFFILLGCTILTFHHSFNSFKLFFLADQIGTALMVLSTYFFINAFSAKEINWKQAIWGAGVAGIAGITQYYGFFPAIAFMLIGASAFALNPSLKKFGSLFTCVLLVCLPQIMWLIFKQAQFGSLFATSVSHLEYLALSFDNLSFYKNVWGIFFFPLLVASFAFIPWFEVARYKALANKTFVFLALTVTFFLVFILLYQWQEARFTTYLLPLSVVLWCLILDRVTGREPWLVVQTLVVGLALYLALIPTNDLMRPSLQKYLKVLTRPARVMKANFLTTLYRTERLDRFNGGQCLIRSADGVWGAAPNCDTYIYANIARYRNIRSR